ncbi:MAG: hypothetical protein Kilf2KO_33850 [Rhodospirillales bacterium]
MSTQDRVLSLKARHEAVEGRIKAESIRPAPDERTLHELKRQKLRIKDEIADLA